MACHNVLKIHIVVVLFTLLTITQQGQQGAGHAQHDIVHVLLVQWGGGSAAGGGGSFGAGEDSPHGRCKKEEGNGEKSKALDKGEEDVDKGKKEWVAWPGILLEIVLATSTKSCGISFFSTSW